MKRVMVLAVIVCLIPLAFAGRQIDCNQDNCTDLVLLYHFNESDGTVFDYSGYGNNASEVGTVAYGHPGIADTAVRFPGGNVATKLLVTHDSSLAFDGFTQSYAIGFWVNGSGASSTFPRYLEDSGLSGYAFSLQGSNALGAFIYDGSNVPGITVSSIQDNTWRHIVFVVDNPSDQLLLYVDGELYDTTTNTVTSTAGGDAGDIHIGNAPFSNDGSTSITMDELFMFNRSVTAAQVRRLFNIGAMPLSDTSGFTVVAGTTDFATVQNMSAVQGLTLANGNGSIRWNGTIDARFDDYDSSITIGSRFVSVDVSALDSSVNSTADVNLTVGLCSAFDVYYLNAPVSNVSQLVNSGILVGSEAGCLQDPCVEVSCAGSTATITVSHFDSIGILEGDVAVPEFHEWALMILLGVCLSGLVAMRRSR